MKTLIVVDMQNDFIDGSLGTKEAQAIVPKRKEKDPGIQKSRGMRSSLQEIRTRVIIWTHRRAKSFRLCTASREQKDGRSQMVWK